MDQFGFNLVCDSLNKHVEAAETAKARVGVNVIVPNVIVPIHFGSVSDHETFPCCTSPSKLLVKFIVANKEAHENSFVQTFLESIVFSLQINFDRQQLRKLLLNWMALTPDNQSPSLCKLVLTCKERA